MTSTQAKYIREAHYNLPEECRYPPASERALANFEKKFAAIPRDYRWYLAECGGGVIGSEWINSIEQLPKTHQDFAVAQQKGFYTLRDFFPVGWDGYGNPYGFDLKTGRIVMEDHAFGGIHEVALDFFDLLWKKGLVKKDA